MRTSGSIEYDERSGGTTRRSRRDRTRRRHRVVLPAAVAASAWALLVAAFASVSRLFGPEGERGTWAEVLVAVVGSFAIAFVIALAVTAFVRASGRPRARAAAQHGDWAPPASPDIGKPAQLTHGGHDTRHVMLRIARAGALGALPGLLIAVVPLLLHEFGVITSDQSQIGFIGVPLVVIGTVVGTLMAASDSGAGGSVLLGTGAGFVVGVAAASLLVASGTGMAGIGLLLPPVCMIAGVAYVVYLHLGEP